MFRRGTLWHQVQGFLLGLLLVPYLALQLVAHGVMLGDGAELVLCSGSGPIPIMADADDPAGSGLGEVCPWAVAGAAALPVPDAAPPVVSLAETQVHWVDLVRFDPVLTPMSLPPVRGPPTLDAVI